MSTLYITLIDISITFLGQMHSCDLVQHEMALELQFVTSLRPTGHFLVFLTPYCLSLFLQANLSYYTTLQSLYENRFKVLCVINSAVL